MSAATIIIHRYIKNLFVTKLYSLPQTWAVIDGSNSTDDNHIILFKWEQIEGPSTVIFENASLSKTNVTGLTKGVYTLKLSVTDDNNNVANDLTYIIVNQSTYF